MTFKESGFRAFYQNFCALPLTEELRGRAGDLPGSAEADSMLTYGFIDREKGLMLEMLCLSQKDGEYYHFFEAPEKSAVCLPIAAVEDLEFSYFPDSEGKMKERYAGRLRGIEDQFGTSEAIEKTRTLSFMDPIRHPYHPDDIQVHLWKDGLTPEACWTRITDLDGRTFIGRLLVEPKQDFSYHQGETIAFHVQETEDHHVFCISNMNPSRILKAEDLEDGSMLKDAIAAFKKDQSQDHLLDILELLRDSYVWIPCHAILSEEDRKQWDEIINNAGDDLSSLVGKTLTSQGPTRLVPDTLTNGQEEFFPVFTTVEDMGEYGEQFSKVQKHMLEAIPMARANEKDLAGIVINAFSDPFILTRQLYDIVEKMKSRIVE